MKITIDRNHPRNGDKEKKFLGYKWNVSRATDHLGPEILLSHTSPKLCFDDVLAVLLDEGYKGKYLSQSSFRSLIDSEHMQAS